MRALTERPLLLAIASYWCMFWLMNALDKVFAREDLGLFTWYGNHRVEKFTMYFERMGWGAEGVVPTLMFAFIVEFVVAALFLYGIVRLLMSKPGAARDVDAAIACSIAVFFGFAVFDVVVGDRAELLEHSTYVGVLLASYLAGAAEGVFVHMRRQSYEAYPAE